MQETLNRIQEDLSSINVTLAEQAVTLKEHIRRTALIEADLVPIKTHVNQVNGAIKFLGIVSVLVGIITAMLRLFGIL